MLSVDAGGRECYRIYEQTREIQCLENTLFFGCILVVYLFFEKALTFVNVKLLINHNHKLRATKDCT